MAANKESKIFGALGSVGLDDLVQLLGMNRRTATLILTRPGEEGRIYFEEGTVIHAFIEDKEGREAVRELVTWHEAEFVIQEGIPPLPETTLSESATSLMLAMATAMDEDSRGGPPARSEPEPPPSAGDTTLPAPIHDSQGVEIRPDAIPDQGRIRSRPRARVTAPVITAHQAQREGLPLGWIAIAVVALIGAIGAGLYFGTGSAEVEPATATPEPTPTQVADATAEDILAGEPATDGATDTETPQDATQAAAPPPTPEPTPEPPAAPEPTPVPTHGFLIVRSDSTATVTLDGRAVGSTPLSRQRLSIGEHSVALQHATVPGIIRETLTIAPGETLQRDYSFTQVGYLQAVVKPWAEVFVDGRSVGQTPMGKVEIAAGRHTVTLKHPEAGEKNQVVNIRVGETTQVIVTLLDPTQ